MLAAHEHDAALRAAKRETETLRTRTEMLDAALTARASLIAELQAACDERLAAAEHAAHARDAALAARANLVEELQAACDERLAAMESLSRDRLTAVGRRRAQGAARSERGGLSSA